MVFNSLNAIIDDILLQYRNSEISESEDLSRLQIEQWVHNYRAKLLREELDKGYDINEEFVQRIGPLHLSPLNCKYKPCECTRRSDEELPSFITLHHGTGLLWIKDLNGNLIQLGDETKAKLQRERKYTCGDYIAWQDGKYLMLDGPCNLEYVWVGGIFEDPTDAGDCFDADNEKYPMPAHLIPVIKDLIFTKELNIMIQMPSDKTNNSQNDVSI